MILTRGKKKIVRLNFKKSKNKPNQIGEKVASYINGLQPNPNEYGYDVSILFHRNHRNTRDAYSKGNSEISYAMAIMKTLYDGLFLEEQNIRSLDIDEVYDHEGIIEVEISWENN